MSKSLWIAAVALVVLIAGILLLTGRSDEERPRDLPPLPAPVPVQGGSDLGPVRPHFDRAGLPNINRALLNHAARTTPPAQ